MRLYQPVAFICPWLIPIKLFEAETIVCGMIRIMRSDVDAFATPNPPGASNMQRAMHGTMHIIAFAEFEHV